MFLLYGAGALNRLRAQTGSLAMPVRSVARATGRSKHDRRRRQTPARSASPRPLPAAPPLEPMRDHHVDSIANDEEVTMTIKHLGLAILIGVFALSGCTATVVTREPHVYFHHYDDDD